MFDRFRPALRCAGALAAAVVLGAASCLLALGARAARADLLLTAGADKKLKIWSVSNGAVVLSKEAHEGAVTAFAFNEQARIFATGGADRKIEIWDRHAKIIVTINDAHDGDVTALAFSQNGKRLYSGGADKRVKTWNVADGKPLELLPALDTPVVGLYVDNGYIAYAGPDGNVKVLDTNLEPVEDLLSNQKGALTATTEVAGQTLLYAGTADGDLCFVVLEGMPGVFDSGQGSAVQAIVALPAVHKVATGGKDGDLKIWAVDPRTQRHTLLLTIDNAHKGGVTALCASPDGKTIVSGGADGKVRFWSSADGAALKTIDAHDGSVTVVFYMDAKSIDRL